MASLDPNELSDIAFKSAADEYTDYAVYKRLSLSRFENKKFSGTLKRLAGMVMEKIAIFDECFPHLRKTNFIERCKNFSDCCETKRNEPL